MKALAVLLVALLLAGCMGAEVPEEALNVTGGAAPAVSLRPGLGAVAGLMLDDRLRPLGGGLVLLVELGRTTSTNPGGEFAFVDLPPGTYTLKASLDGHEARPEEVAVAAGEFTEVEIVARRVVSEGSTIITQEYSVFIPCAADYVFNGGNVPCTLELSNDGYQSFFTSNLTTLPNVTYVVTEMKANQAKRFEVQVRATGENGTLRYAVAQFEGDYVKIVNRVGDKNFEHEAIPSYGENVPFATDLPFTTLLFVDHEHREAITGAWPANPGSPVWINPCCGVGFSMGIKAKFVQSIFLGEPEVDISTYRVYS